MVATKSKDENKESYEDFNSSEKLSNAGRPRQIRANSLATNQYRKPKEGTVEYISEMIVELRDMADSSDYVLLAYLLDMAYEEAVTTANKR